MPIISIVVPFSGATLDLLPDLDSATQGAELIIVDNASSPETVAALQSLPATRGVVIRNETNLGFAAGNNQGYARATGDVIVFLNSDIAADPAWLQLVAQDVKDGALYGPSVQQQLVYGRWLWYIEGWCIAATRTTWAALIDAWNCSEYGSCYGEPYDEAAVWDEHAYPGPYWEDNDLCFRAMLSGLALIQTQWPIQHKGGRTAGPLIAHAASFEANRATFAGRVAAVWERMQHGAR